MLDKLDVKAMRNMLENIRDEADPSLCEEVNREWLLNTANDALAELEDWEEKYGVEK